MAFLRVIAALHALFDAVGLPGNLLVIVTIVLESRFHVMRHILLASLAVSDFLFLIFVNSFRIASIAHERWLYGQTTCLFNAFFARFHYCNTVLHLIAVSYDRYNAIVKSPLTYDGMVTKSKVVFVVLIWVGSMLLSIGPFFLVGGKYVYKSEMFVCRQGWLSNSGSSRWHTVIAIIAFIVPFLMIVFLNWSVYKTAKVQANVIDVQERRFDGSEGQHQKLLRQSRSKRRAAVDVSIIIAAFLLCYLPFCIVDFLRLFVQSVEVPAEVVLVTACIFIFSSLCNPIVYSIRKREFRVGVKNVFWQIGLCGSDNDMFTNGKVIAGWAPTSSSM